jgi:hypothetical protein
MSLRRFSFANAKHLKPEPQAAFVACPMVVAQMACCSQQESLREIYRVAFERAWELHRPSRWAPLYAASQN